MWKDIQVSSRDNFAIIALTDFSQEVFIIRTPVELMIEDQQSRLYLVGNLSEFSGRGMKTGVIALPDRFAPLEPGLTLRIEAAHRRRMAKGMTKARN